jgi:hypothetical protein
MMKLKQIGIFSDKVSFLTIMVVILHFIYNDVFDKKLNSGLISLSLESTKLI